jgi:ketosteroid isomerase-like protein
MTTAINNARKRELYEQSLVHDAHLNADGLAELWHPEGTFQIGAMPPVAGRESIRAFFKQFFSYGLFTKLEHEMRTVWELPDALVYEAVAIYTRPDGSTLRSPYVNVVRHRDGLFGDYRVYIDTKPLTG